MDYSDMMGLEMYEGDGLGQFLDGESLRRSLMAAGSGGLGILLTTYVWQMQALNDALPADPTNRTRIKNVLAVALGVVGGRAIYGDGTDQARRDYAMGFLGGVGGLGMAGLIASFLPTPAAGETSNWASSIRTLSTPGTGFSGGMRGLDLAALEAAVATNSPSWSAGNMMGLAAPVVRDQALASTGTTTEDIAGYGYAPPPSF